MSQHGPTLTVRRAGSVSEDATVRHVDQLPEEDLATFVAMASGEHGRPSGLAPGDVVVYAGYYRVERADARVGERTRGATEAGEAAPDGGEVVPGQQ